MRASDEADIAGRKSASPHANRLPTIAAVLLPAIAFGILGWERRWTADDAFIHFRVVDQLLHGNGPVFNAGERIEASTSVLWVFVLASARTLTFHQIRIEYLALWISLIASCCGVLMASLAALRLTRRGVSDGPATVLPFGILIVVGTRAFWDFATSGLEMGLVLAWLGGCFLGCVTLARADEEARRRGRWPLLVLLGLGPLIRPDLIVFSMSLVVAVLIVDKPRSRAGYVQMIVVACAVPVAYQIFRMGYYAELVPNPAIAKNATDAQWQRGFNYFGDLITTYQLWIPLLLVGMAAFFLVRRLWASLRIPEMTITLSVVVGAALHAAYIVRVGGDFMHARLLLPSIFAVAMPVAVVAVHSRLIAISVFAMVAWGIIAAFAFQATASLGDVIGNERLAYVRGSGVRNPVTLDDYARTDWVIPALEARKLAEHSPGKLVFPEEHTLTFTEPAATYELDGIPQPIALVARAVGAASFAAGPDVYVVDRYGLGDVIGSHLAGTRLLKPGHDKLLPRAWVEGRFATPDSLKTLPVLAQYRAILARQAIDCGELAGLLRDTRAPLTATRFIGNITRAVKNTTLGIPPEPQEAADKFCGANP